MKRKATITKQEDEFFRVLRDVVACSQYIEKYFKQYEILFKVQVTLQDGFIALTIAGISIWNSGSNDPVDLIPEALLSKFKALLRRTLKQLPSGEEKDKLTEDQRDMLEALLKVNSKLTSKDIDMLDSVDKRWRYIGLTPKQNKYLEGLFLRFC